MLGKRNTQKNKIKKIQTTKAARLEQCSDVLVPLSSFIFSFTKHLWICNDVYMHFPSRAKRFGLSNHCRHVNKGLAWPLTAAPIANTWNLTNRNENNLIMHATPSAQHRIQLFKQHCKHLLTKRIWSPVKCKFSSQLQEFLVHQKAFAQCQTLVIHY